MSFAPNSHHITSFVSYSRQFRWVQQRPITHDTTIKRRVAHQWRVVAPLDKHIGCWHKMMSNIRFLLIRFHVYRFLRLPRSFFFCVLWWGPLPPISGFMRFVFEMSAIFGPRIWSERFYIYDVYVRLLSLAWHIVIITQQSAPGPCQLYEPKRSCNGALVWFMKLLIK